MKTQPTNSLAAIVIAILLVFCSCGAKTTKMDTTTFDKAFQTASSDVQALATKASKAFRDGKFEEGANTLVDIARKGTLTEEQKDGIRDVIVATQTIMAEDAKKSDLKVYQAVEEVTAILENRPAQRVGVNPSALGRPNQ